MYCVWHYDETNSFIKTLTASSRSLRKLRHLHIHLDGFDHFTCLTGSSGITFRMDDDEGKSYALKILMNKPGQSTDVDRYRILEKEVNSIDSEYFIKMKFYEDEFHYRGKSYCVVLTDWVEGLALNRYIERNCYDKCRMSWLAYRFGNLASWLCGQPFANCDIKASDIIVRPDNSLVVIDYDNMYFPSLAEYGSNMDSPRYFDHPLRKREDFNPHLDDFPLSLLALTTKMTSLDSNFWGLLTEVPITVHDLSDLSKSEHMKFLRPYMADVELQRIYGLFLIALSQGDLHNVDSSAFLLSKPTCPEFGNFKWSPEKPDEFND